MEKQNVHLEANKRVEVLIKRAQLPITFVAFIFFLIYYYCYYFIITYTHNGKAVYSF